MTRIEFAERIAAGLSGWFQQLAAQELDSQVGEDAARVELVRTISSLRQYVPETSKRPTNWPKGTRKRIDIAVMGRSETATGWYGAIELKWPGKNFDVATTRQKIVEDAVRIIFADTANLNARFVVLGGTKESLDVLFDKNHPAAQGKEDQRIAFCDLFSRDTANATGRLTNDLLNTHFPDFGDRVPQTVFNGWSRRLQTQLVATASSDIGAAEKGRVYVWQCSR